jgi:tRNA pseudouridine38-40 synthase
MNKKNVKLTLSFDGKPYCGWQKQKKQASIQGILEEILSKLMKETIKISGAGRTDSGVHAIRYTANFLTNNFSMSISKLPVILNFSLPEEIRIISAEETDVDFHSRFSALAREYIYIIYQTGHPLPFFLPYTYYRKKPIDIKKIKKACSLFVGKHNFKNFCIGYGEEGNTERQIFYFRAREIKSSYGSQTVFFIKGNGFLRGMIRNIIAACLNYADGKTSLSEIKKALKNKTKLPQAKRGQVPAQGLYFKRAYYPQ